MARRELGRLEEARADLDRLISVEATSDMLAARGEVLRRLGDRAGALADLDRSVALCAVDPFAYIARGRVHLTEGRAEAAIQDFDLAIQHDCDGIAARHHRARARRIQGNDAAARADWEAALHLAREQVSRDPQEYRARTWIAWIHAEGLGEGLHEALALMEDVRARVRDFDRRADFLEILGRVHYRLGNLEEALRFQEQAHALCPADVEVTARLEEVRRAAAG